MRLAVFIGILACGAFGQAAEKKLEFEAATVKPAPPPSDGKFFIGSRGGPGTADPGRVTYNFFSLKQLLTIAYGVKPYQVSGPAWLDSERFDVAATIPEGATKEQFNTMLQNLLTERFGIELHHETKDFPLYELSVAKGGPKLKPSVVDPNAPPNGALPPPPPPGPPPVGKDGRLQLPAGRKGMMMMMNPKGMHVMANVQTVSALADMLGNQLGMPVLDKTGLSGNFDYSLDFSRESLPNGGLLAGMPPPPPPPGGGLTGPDPGAGPAPTSDQSEAPSLFTAVQEQLGLKLDKKRGPLDMLVIDSANKTPADN
jgi:uncharacterized protein (TIGR03435 family)